MNKYSILFICKKCGGRDRMLIGEFWRFRSHVGEGAMHHCAYGCKEDSDVQVHSVEKTNKETGEIVLYDKPSVDVRKRWKSNTQ